MDSIDRCDWQRFRDGEAEAMGRLYRRHKDSLLTYCVYTTGDRQLSEDIVQEVFMKLMEQKQSANQIDSVRNWLFICVRNRTYNALRERRIRQYEPLDSTTPNSSIEQKLFVEQVLARLPAEDRELIILRELQGFGTAELAQMLSLSEEAVRVRLYRVRKKMHELGKA